MLRMLVSAGCLLAIVCAADAQTADPKLTFEVASVKPNETGLMSASNNPGQVTRIGIPLKGLITQFFDLRPYQYDVPSWMETARYDVVAKVPAGTTAEQRAIMLQNLLVERFRIRLHHEQREGTVYDLVLVKGGPKLRPADADENVPADRAPKLTYTSEKFPVIPPGQHPYTARYGLGGQTSIVTNKCSMQQLASLLTDQLQRPVLDRTGIQGDYAFLLHYMPIPRDMTGGIPALQAAGIVAPAPPAVEARPGTAASSSALPDPGATAGDPAPTIFEAVQKQLGLRLEKRKAPVDVLVIDYAEKVPIEN
jgi:uncharacterized protein (TIGR03435 family)